jgi:hypothetical protein
MTVESLSALPASLVGAARGDLTPPEKSAASLEAEKQAARESVAAEIARRNLLPEKKAHSWGDFFAAAQDMRRWQKQQKGGDYSPATAAIVRDREDWFDCLLSEHEKNRPAQCRNYTRNRGKK